jgi:hypothetical protein
MLRSTLALALSLAAVAPLAGCQLAGFMAANEARHGTKKVQAAYTGLRGHSYAVVVQADRDVLAENPNLMEHLLASINNRLAEHAEASGHVPTDQLILYLMNNTRWPAMGSGDLARELGDVERLVILDLADYRLTEPGNQYVWQGVAQGRLSVFEADGQGGGQTVFEREVRVTFPDESGITPDAIPRTAVTSVLSSRLVDRVVWLFHDHEEPNQITY